MKTITPKSEAGYALLEALISLIVVAVGVLGIAKMNMVMLAGTGVAKTRAEALQLAQTKFDEFRNVTTAAQYVALSNGNDSLSGTNASYSRSWQIDGTTSPTNARVCVAWPSSVSDACAATTDRIILSGIVSWNNPAELAKVSSTSSLGGFIRTPTGRGRVGGDNVYTPGSIPGVANSIPGGGSDGTHTYVTDGGTRELIGADGKVLLTVNKAGSCESTAPEFSTVSGRVFIEAKNGSPIASFSNIFVLSSDASYCSVLPVDTTTTPWKLPTGCTGSACTYFYTYYQCYIGAYWWGNIGIQRIDNANTNDKVCVGNPVDTAAPNALFDRRAALNTSHAYRGYYESGGTGSGIYSTLGIGEQNGIAAECNPTNQTYYKYIPTHYKNHNLIHANLTGSQSCNSAESTVHVSAPLGTAVGTAGNPAVVSYDENDTVISNSTNTSAAYVISTANNNPGKYFCMSNDDGGYSISSTCPNLPTVTPTPTTVIHGTITRYSGAALTGINTSNNACKAGSTTWTVNGTTSYSYSCTLDWTGFTGGSWYGVIPFTPVGTASLCAVGATTTVEPSGNSVAYAINDSAASSDPNSLYFSDVPLAVTDVTINLDVYGSPCGIGAPNPTWATSGNNPRPLNWSAISGATGYRVYKTTGCGDVTSCIVNTSGAGTLQTGTSYDLGSVSNNTTTCVVLKSTNGTQDSVDSPKKCMSRSGGTYTPS